MNKKSFIASAAFLAMFALTTLPVAAQSGNRKKCASDHVPQKTTERILTVFERQRKNIHDLNADGKINCVDYAIQFKLEWDKLYNDDDCYLVRNYNPKYTGMNHLFAAVYCEETCLFVLVETWASNVHKFLMEDNWDNHYNPAFNIYSESDWWMGRVRQ